MLGRYENFPETIHGIASFTFRASRKKVQKAIVTTFYELNQRKCGLEEIAHYSAPNCVVDFEFGFGESVTFTFLNKNESRKVKNEISSNPLIYLDFLCVLQYHIVNKLGKRSPLKFDYYLLRFVFERNFMEFLVSHERGPRRIYVEDLIEFLVKRVKRRLAELYSVVLKPERKQTV